MSKIKIFAVAGILSLVAIVLANSPVIVSKAEGDEILREIAAYKTWTKITKEPLSFRIGVLPGQFQIDGASGSE